MSSLLSFLKQTADKSVDEPAAMAVGRISRVIGMTLEARGISVSLGTRCLVENGFSSLIETEVVGFDQDRTFLMPLAPVDRVAPGSLVSPLTSTSSLPAGDCLLGRVVNGLGDPIDDLGVLKNSEHVSLFGESINPLKRSPIKRPLDVGIRSINAALTVGRGQRIGLFAGSGVGKSVLLGMMTRFTEADVVIVALVGERGREVREFIEENLGETGLSKSIVVASPADETPVMRMRAGRYATRLAEYFRDRGKSVLLLFDSLTRYAQAQREIALAIGEPPATRGYPASAFSVLPQLVERAGNGMSDSGSVTAIYTVLTEGDDLNDPVADAARAILDGHVVLSRQIASEGIYPAVDLTTSISRSMQNVVSEQQFAEALVLKKWLARYEENKDLISVGAYTAGVDADTDIAIAKQAEIREFLSQGTGQQFEYAQSVQMLQALVAVSVENASEEANTENVARQASAAPT